MARLKASFKNPVHVALSIIAAIVLPPAILWLELFLHFLTTDALGTWGWNKTINGGFDTCALNLIVLLYTAGIIVLVYFSFYFLKMKLNRGVSVFQFILTSLLFYVLLISFYYSFHYSPCAWYVCNYSKIVTGIIMTHWF